MKRRILLVIDNLGSGGAQRQIVNLAAGLKSNGYDVKLFIYHKILHFDVELEAVGVPLFCAQKKHKYSLSPIFELRRLIKSWRIQTVIAFLETPSLYAEIAALGISDVNLIVSERSMYPDGVLPIKLTVLQELHRLADKITVNSDHQRKNMVRKFPWMEGKISTIYNGYDLGKYEGSSNDYERSNHYLAIASVASKKNPMNLARALKVLRDRHGVSVKIMWVGVKTVANEGDATFRETEAYLEKNGLANNWTWLGVRNDVPALLRDCKALIHPSYFEGLPNVICEALASSTPVLASCVCDHPILVGDPARGYLFDPASPESIADAIRRFEELSKEKKKMMGENARDYAISNLSINALTRKYSELVEC